MTFRSKIDAWFPVLTLALPLALIGAVIAGSGALTASEWLVLAPVTLIAIGLPAWLLLSTRYEIASGKLLVRSGPFRWSVPLADIQSVRPSRSLISSPALSLDRLEIRYGKGRTLLVSPEDKAGFQRALGESAR